MNVSPALATMSATGRNNSPSFRLLSDARATRGSHIMLAVRLARSLVLRSFLAERPLTVYA